MSRDAARERKPARRRGPIAIALAICAIAGGGQALVPAPAAAMTSEELTAICSSVFGEIGDPTICVTDTQSGSGGPAGYGATEPSQGVIVIVAPKPEGVDCGFGIYALRRADCPGKPGANANWILTQPGVRVVRVGAWEPPSGPRPGRLMSCILARTALHHVQEAKRYLAGLERQLDRDGYLNVEVRKALYEKVRQWADQFSHDAWTSVFGSKSPALAWAALSDRDFMRMLGKVWDAAVKKANRDVKDPFCAKAPVAGAP